MSVRSTLSAMGRSAGLLTAVWLVLAAVGWASGVLPVVSGAESSTVDESGPGGSAPDGAVGDDSGSEAAPTETESPSEIASVESEVHPEEMAEPAAPTTLSGVLAEGRRWRLCGADDVVISRGDLFGGDGRDELLVACEGEVQVWGFVCDDVTQCTPLRLARVRLDGEDSVHAVAPVVADVDGDGIADLLAGFTKLDPEGSPDGGTLVWARGTATGALAEAQRLAPIAASALVVHPTEDRDGTDFAAVHHADGHGRRPSELWIFQGGPSPLRIGRERLPSHPLALAWTGSGLAANGSEGNVEGEEAAASETSTSEANDAQPTSSQGDVVYALMNASVLPFSLPSEGERREPEPGESLSWMDIEPSTEDQPVQVRRGDLDGDGGLETVVLAHGRLWMLTAGGLAPIRWPESGPSDGPQEVTPVRGVTMVDLEGDGSLALVVLGQRRLSALHMASEEGESSWTLGASTHLPVSGEPHGVHTVGSRVLISMRDDAGVWIAERSPLATSDLDEVSPVREVAQAPLHLDVVVR